MCVWPFSTSRTLGLRLSWLPGRWLGAIPRRYFTFGRNALSQEVDRLVVLLAVFEQDLLFVDSLALSYKGLCLLQGQTRIHLKPLRLRLIANPHDYAIANHLVLQITVITVLR